MIFLSKPSAYFLPNTWEAPNVTYDLFPAEVQMLALCVMIAAVALLSTRRKRKLN
jgi:hypothetical protein|tara:strand:- start:1609 stop:1773 length:165 start_codon:yes stop_codon:yes gene_type:complete